MDKKTMPRKMQDLDEFAWKLGKEEVGLLKKLAKSNGGDAYLTSWDSLAFTMDISRRKLRGCYDHEYLVERDRMWSLAHFALENGRCQIIEPVSLVLWDTTPSYTNGYEWSQEASKGTYKGDLIIALDNKGDLPKFEISLSDKVKEEVVHFDSW